jgi:hypothetical protein
MVIESALRQEGAKIAREAEHSATFKAAQAELAADLKRMSPGNYAEVLRQILDTNRVDVKSNPTLPDIYFTTSKGSLLPDGIYPKPPSQAEVATRIFAPPSKSPYANLGHVLLSPGENPTVSPEGAHPTRFSDKSARYIAPTSEAKPNQTKPAHPELVARSVMELVIDKALGK